jgi:hypothetical protein
VIDHSSLIEHPGFKWCMVLAGKEMSACLRSVVREKTGLPSLKLEMTSS